MVQRQFYPFFKTTSKPSRHSQDNLQKTSRKLSETIQTTVRHLEDTSDNLFRHLTVLKYDITGWVGGWLSGPHYIIIPLRGPTCKLKTCKNSSELEFQVGPECGKIGVPMLCILYAGTVPMLCILNVGTVPMLCILNVGTVPML